MYEIRISLVSKHTDNRHYYFIVRNIDNEIVYYRVVDNNIKKRITKSYINKLLRLKSLELVFTIHLRNFLLSKESIIRYTI